MHAGYWKTVTTPMTPPVQDDSGATAPRRNPFATLPAGWTTEADPNDGRIFYWHAASGTSSWTHPNAAISVSSNITSRDQGSRPRSPDESSFHYVPAPNSSFPRTQAGTAAPLPPLPAENPYMASRRPDNHQCGAIAALILCPPLGIFALYHSIRVDQCWKAGQYSDAFVHSRQSPQFSSWGMMIGIIFWICWFFFRRGRGEWEWPDWKFGD